jgi:hypothetical protein
MHSIAGPLPERLFLTFVLTKMFNLHIEDHAMVWYSFLTTKMTWRPILRRWKRKSKNNQVDKLRPRLHYTARIASERSDFHTGFGCCLHYATVIRYATRSKNHSALEVIWKVIRYVPEQCKQANPIRFGTKSVLACMF